MAKALKLVYSESFFEQLLERFSKVNSNFTIELWNNRLYDCDWENLELKQRMRQISKVIHSFLDEDFTVSYRQLLDLFNQIKKDSPDSLMGFELMFFPDFIEVYGLEYFEESMRAMTEITKIASCEFAIRPFLIKYPNKGLKQMILWSKHEHHSVRRLSTEGCRPRLPWAMALPVYKKDPSLILPILESLRADESEFVRRSVANNLNDISKDNPTLMFDLVSQWKNESKEVDWVIKHGCRTLLKQGDPRVMSLFDYCNIEDIRFSDFKIITPEVEFGKSLEFQFKIENRTNKEVKIRVEYGVYFLKANGSLPRKVFKISETTYIANQKVIMNRKQPIKPISTRKYYFGAHEVSVIINGIEFSKLPFVLKE